MKVRNLRWVIAGLLLLASILNYVDRQALSILAPTIQADLRLSDADYGRIVSFFLIAYTAASLLSGRIVDALGPRVSLALFVGWWSVANIPTGFAKSFGSLGACRFLLGLGEAGGYTASPKIVRQWFPPKDRGIAVGLYSVGGALGATIAPVLVLTLTAHFGWRGAFFVTGAIGLVFVAVWLLVFRDPETHPWLTDGEQNLILADDLANKQQAVEPVLTESGRWRSIPTSRAVCPRMFARLLADPVWYFFIAAGGAVCGILMNETVARTIATHSYAPCFYAMVVLHPLAWLLLRRFSRKPWATAAA